MSIALLLILVVWVYVQRYLMGGNSPFSKQLIINEYIISVQGIWIQLPFK